VLAQRLVRKLCPECKRADARGRYHPVGCAACSTTGYKGRTGVYELMVADEKVRSLIHSRAAESQLFVRRRGGLVCARCARTASASSTKASPRPKR
jgi:general secretion pathway protein E